MNRIVLSILLLAASFAAAAESPRTLRMEVNGLVCAFCAHGIQKALSKHAAAGEVFVDLEDRLVAVELKGGGDIGDDEINRAMTDAGYTVVSIARVDETLAAIKARYGGDE